MNPMCEKFGYPGMVDLNVILDVGADVFAALCQTMKEAWKKS